MAIPYIFISQRTPPDDNGRQKEVTYARTVSRAVADTEEISRNISRRCTVNPADVLAVLFALGDELSSRLQDGESVSLEGIGTFRIIAGTGVIEDPTKVRSRHFTRKRINFHPDTKLSRCLRSLTFIRKRKR